MTTKEQRAFQAMQERYREEADHMKIRAMGPFAVVYMYPVTTTFIVAGILVCFALGIWEIQDATSKRNNTITHEIRKD